MTPWLASLLISSYFVVGSARAQPTRPSVGDQLVPDHQALLARRERAMSVKLAHLLGGLAQVERVHAEVMLADASRLPIDEPLAAPRVSLVLQVRAPVAEQDVLDLVRRAAEDFAEARVSVVQSPALLPAPVPERLHQVGPFRVAAGSDWMLRSVLAGLLATNVILASLLLARLRRERHLP